MSTQTGAPVVGSSIFLKGVRIAFAEGIFEATQFEGKGEPRYGCRLLVEKGSDADTAIKAEMSRVAKKEWGDRAEAIVQSIIGRPQSCCYYPGDLKEYDGFKGKMALAANRNAKKGAPLVIDRDKSPLTVHDGRPYSGCIVNAKVNIWAQDNQYGQAIRCTLETIQFSKDADAFGSGGPATADGFEVETDSSAVNDLF